MTALRSRRALRRAALFASVCLALSSVAPAHAAADDPQILRLRGEAFASAGRCEEAIPVLERAAEGAPRDARIPLVIGQCQIRLRHYPEAVAALERARALDASLTEVDLSLGIAQYHEGDLAAAAQSLEAARAHGGASSQLDLYEGLLLLQRARAREAAEALERASAADSKSVDPAATYYAALAWEEADEGEASAAALERVITGWPGTSWADAAAKLRDAQRRAHLPTWWAVATAGMETDTNPTLVGRNVVLFPNEAPGQQDARGIWSFEFGSEFWKSDPWSAGGRVYYYGNAYHDLTEFNTEYPSLSLWLDRRLGDADTVRMQYDFGYAWVGGDPFLATQWLTPSWYHDWGALYGTTRVFSEVVFNNYFVDEDEVVSAVPSTGACPPGVGVCGPPGVNEAHERNADGFGTTFGVEHIVPLGVIQTDVVPGLRFGRYVSHGSEWSNTSYDFRIATHTRLPYDTRLDVIGGYTYAPYRNRSTFPTHDEVQAEVPGQPYVLAGPRRSDDIGYVDASLEHKLTTWLSCSVRYAFQNHHSNTDVFDFHEHVLGAYLTLRLHD
ncbi:MAG TPA: tetratricopeptide repeat protein [Myxococcota bacterium]|jgi:tetratricopeptide (TPR) repeat protein|nr:tetratricopeptide repeat protein [Myxococcota bacterium]